MYSNTQVAELWEARAKTLKAILEFIDRAIDHPYRTDRGREFGRHGLCRRLQVLHRSLGRVFELIPPKSRQLPGKQRREDAEIYFSSFLIATYGAIDNLAWIWTIETGLTKSNGQPLARSQIGLRPENEVVVGSLPTAIQAKLRDFSKWFEQNSDYRHALAHRIPPYVPPYAVSPRNVAEDAALDADILAAAVDGNSALVQKLRRRQRRVRAFVPVIQHSWGDKATPIKFHATLVADSRTVIDLASDIFDALRSRN